tara:strand:- start:102 stop:632 length:531 start_codon:yes stop_codon:yes gene_type:complete
MVILGTQMELTGIQEQEARAYMLTSTTRGTSYPDKGDCAVTVLSPKDVPKVWGRAKELIAKAEPFSDGEWKADDFFLPLVDGEMQLWIGVANGELILSAITEVAFHPRKKVLRVVAIGGSGLLDRLDKTYAAIESFGVQCGCTAVEICATRKWGRILKDWDETGVVLTKPIQGRLH